MLELNSSTEMLRKWSRTTLETISCLKSTQNETQNFIKFPKISEINQNFELDYETWQDVWWDDLGCDCEQKQKNWVKIDGEFDVTVAVFGINTKMNNLNKSKQIWM